MENGPEGFELKKIDMVSKALTVFSQVDLMTIKFGFLHGKEAWVRPNAINSNMIDVIPITNGDWSGLFYVVDKDFAV